MFIAHINLLKPSRPQPAVLHACVTCRAQRRGVVTRAAAGNGSGKRITQQEFTEKAWQAVVAAPEIATEYQQQVRLRG
jgi:ATP-dependent Clp protease ATP-binding subunit ClpB